MDACVLSIGSELTYGQTVDTNAAWLSQRLAGIGISTQLHVTVADDLEAVAAEIKRICGRVGVLLISGGLGPTPDDLTRQALASAMGVALELREEYVEKIRDFFTVRGREMPEANTVQAMFPAGAAAIENTCGTAPGIRVDFHETLIFVMPGVPREMKVMFERDVLPILAKQSGGQVLLATTLYSFGEGESTISMKIHDLMERGRNPAVGTTAKQGVIGIRIHARGDSQEEASRLLEDMADQVRSRLGPLIFGENDGRLAVAVARLLAARGETVSTAESCTGGLIAKSLTDISGSSNYFLQGLVTYSNEAKMGLLDVPGELIDQHGAVSEQVAHAMAVNCRAKSGSDYALSVTGIAGPTGGTPQKPVGLVYIGLADKDGCEVTEHRIGEFLSREDIRDRTHKTALNRLRLKLVGETPKGNFRSINCWIMKIT